MTRTWCLSILCSMMVPVIALPAAESAPAPKAAVPVIKIVKQEADKRVDVLVDDQPFTSYVWPEAPKKPVLYPLRTAKGALITRGFPPTEGERTDHPHHVGFWFNYGDVDGVDFWGHSDAGRAEDPKRKYGTIFHRAIKQARGGAGKGQLVVASEWVGPDGQVMLKEETAFGFQAGDGRRAIDRVATLTAANGEVKFPDTKEGMLGLRVVRALEYPSNKPEVFADASGKPTPVARLDNKGVTGQYHGSDGTTGEAVWGTRGRWMVLAGVVAGDPVTVAILDHPRNPGHPTHWHARGYGLFAANPLGIKDFTKGKETFNFSIGKGKSVRFAYRLLILSHDAKADELEAEYKRFLAEVK